MVSNRAKELWGVDFSIVPEGLSEEEVVAYVNNLKALPPTDGTIVDQQSSLVKLAEQTVIEAHKLAESILEQARADAEMEANRIRVEAEGRAREQSQHILEAVESEADAKADVLVAKAEQQGQQALKRARRAAQDMLQSAQQKADDIRSEAKLEAEFTLRKLTTRVADEIGAAVTNICNHVLPALDNFEEDSADKPHTGNGQSNAPAVATTRLKAKPSTKKG